MALTINQAQTLLTWPMFLQRVQYQMVTTAQAVYTEGTGVTNHAIRAARATAILQNPANYTAEFAQAVVAQLPLTTTNIVGNTDVDTTDTAIATEISAVYNAHCGA